MVIANGVDRATMLALMPPMTMRPTIVAPLLSFCRIAPPRAPSTRLVPDL